MFFSVGCILRWPFPNLFSDTLLDGSLVSPPAAAPDASSAVAALEKADVLALFQQLLPLPIFWAALKQAKVRENNRVYTSAVVVWLMVSIAFAGGGYAGERRAG